MIKLVKIAVVAAVIGLGVFSMNTVTAKAEEVVELNDCGEPEGPVEIISIEDIEFASQEEALAYLSEQYGLALPFSIYEMGTSSSIGLNGNRLAISASTSSKIGTASSIGVKNLYLQYSYAGTDMFGNKLIEGTLSQSNTDYYCSLFYYSDLEHLTTYRVKMTHFMIVNGVEYRYSTTSTTVTYYQN